MIIPTLTTERLTLRAYHPDDFPTYAALMASERATYMDGPYGESAAWSWFANDTAAWLLFGYGTLAIVEGERLAGFAGLVKPPAYPEPECGWGLYDGFTGRGLASEAARAVLAHTFATTDLTSIVSYIHPDNAASCAVAERIGGTLDADAARPDASDLVYRHFPRGIAA